MMMLYLRRWKEVELGALRDDASYGNATGTEIPPGLSNKASRRKNNLKQAYRDFMHSPVIDANRKRLKKRIIERMKHSLEPKVQGALEREDVYGVPNGKFGKLVAVILHEGADERTTAKGESENQLYVHNNPKVRRPKHKIAD
jgi:hypothetical protein